MSKANRKRITNRIAAIVLCVLLSAGMAPTAYAAEVRATPTESAVILDGRQLTCAAYNVGGSNYFKLRDLMQALNYGVGYDSATQSIAISTSKPYVPDGSETSARIAALPAGVSYAFFPAQANPSTANVIVDGQPVSWAAYNIYGNNYFKLRDIGEALNFSVVWDAQSDRVVLDTSKGYFVDDTVMQTSPEPAAPDVNADELKTEIVRLINNERVKAGLPELQILPALMDCAQAKADDMVENRYFGHTSPVYGTAGEMIKTFVPNSKSRGENLAPWRRTPEEFIEGLRGSPLHLENALNPRDTHIGIGITLVTGGGFVCVQHFVRL